MPVPPLPPPPPLPRIQNAIYTSVSARIHTLHLRKHCVTMMSQSNPEYIDTYTGCLNSLCTIYFKPTFF